MPRPSPRGRRHEPGFSCRHAGGQRVRRRQPALRLVLSDRTPDASRRSPNPLAPGARTRGVKRHKRHDLHTRQRRRLRSLETARSRRLGLGRCVALLPQGGEQGRWWRSLARRFRALADRNGRTAAANRSRLHRGLPPVGIACQSGFQRGRPGRCRSARRDRSRWPALQHLAMLSRACRIKAQPGGPHWKSCHIPGDRGASCQRRAVSAAVRRGGGSCLPRGDRVSGRHRFAATPHADGHRPGGPPAPARNRGEGGESGSGGRTCRTTSTFRSGSIVSGRARPRPAGPAH